MLWTIFDPCGDGVVPAEQRAWIMQRYRDIGHRNRLNEDLNSVKKVPIL